MGLAVAPAAEVGKPTPRGGRASRARGLAVPAIVAPRMIRGLVSIVTPTHARPGFLRRAQDFVRQQDYREIEWLVLDDSPPGCETCEDIAGRGVFYERVCERMSIGEKRNRLIDRARGEIVIHFDDDDYYAPHYVTTMLAALAERNADLVNLRGWFLYDLRSRFFGYWDLECKLGLHYQCDWNGVEPMMLTPENNGAFVHNHLGFGFSYAFRKRVWNAVKFPDRDWGEDAEFTLAVGSRFRIDGVHDRRGVCLHLLHPASSSRCYPQHHLPDFLLDQVFPLQAPLAGIAGAPAVSPAGHVVRLTVRREGRQ